MEQTYTKFRKTVGLETNNYGNSFTKYSELLIVANGNHKVDKVPFENLNSPYEKTISETKDKNSMTLEKRIDKSDPATVGD